jgi:hypothetical protein
VETSEHHFGASGELLSYQNSQLNGLGKRMKQQITIIQHKSNKDYLWIMVKRSKEIKAAILKGIY